MITQDFISGLPRMKWGYDRIMVVVDHGLSKGVKFIPTNKDITELQMAQLQIDHIFKWFGLPDDIISNRDPLFTSKTYQNLLKLLGIKQRLSTAYHPETDEETERVNREIETYIFKYSAKEFQKIGIDTYPLQNFPIMDNLIQ